jgi:hypothetical protein
LSHFFHVSCVFNGERPRWKNTTVPYPGTIIQITGICSHVTQDGLLAVDVDNIVLNVPTSPSSALANENEDAGASGASKKRKFRAFASDNNASSKRCAHDSAYDESPLTFASLSLPPTQKNKTDRTDDDSLLPSRIQWEKYVLHFYLRAF